MLVLVALHSELGSTGWLVSRQLELKFQNHTPLPILLVLSSFICDSLFASA